MYAIGNRSENQGGLLPGDMNAQPLGYKNIHGFFREGVSLGAVDANVSRIACKDSSDAERLESFRTLKTLAMAEHLHKFQLFVMHDLLRGGAWSYEFSINDESLYESESTVLGHDQTSVQYEYEYLKQSVFGEGNAEQLLATLQLLRDSAANANLSHTVRLAHFQQLLRMVPVEQLGKLEEKVSVNHATGKWAYQLLIDKLCLVRRDGIDMDDGKDMASFLNNILLVRFCRALNIHDGDTWPAPQDIARQLMVSKLGAEASLAKNVEWMANLSCVKGKAISIEVKGTRFSITFLGKTLFEGEIPASPEDEGITARVQIAMSALRVALTPLQGVYQAILGSSDLSTPYLKNMEERETLTLRQAIDAYPGEVPAMKVKSLADRLGIYSAYEIYLVCEDNEERRFDVAEFKPRHRDSEYEMKVRKNLCHYMHNDIYLEAVSEMNGAEILVLQTQINKTYFDGVTLGMVFDVDRPDDDELEWAFNDNECEI